jgi:hypothetical protein
MVTLRVSVVDLAGSHLSPDPDEMRGKGPPRLGCVVSAETMRVRIVWGIKRHAALEGARP